MALQLVESYRDHEGRPRQKIILSLGNISIPKHLWKEVANEIDNRLKGIISLLETSEGALNRSSEKKYLQDMEKLSKRLDAGRLKSLDTPARALGRIQERHPRVNRYYRAKITKNEEGSHLTLERLDKEYSNALQLCWGYYLRCSKRDCSAEEIWKIYMMLTRVETGFRTLKSDLGLRPIYHQKEERCESHIFITILAYHLLQ